MYNAYFTSLYLQLRLIIEDTNNGSLKQAQLLKHYNEMAGEEQFLFNLPPEVYVFKTLQLR